MTRVTDDILFDKIIIEEGKKYTNDPVDPGGPTKFGITLIAWQGFSGKAATEDTIKNLTLIDAKAFYLATHIRPFDFLEDPLRPLMIDVSIMRGVKSSIMMLQGSVLGIVADGWIGNITKTTLRKMGSVVSCNILVGAMLHHFALQVKNTPAKVKYLEGWRNRILAYYI